jgi:hypothetical protein
MFKLRKKREITKLEKNEIIIDYLNSMIELYNHTYLERNGLEMIKEMLLFEETKRKFLQGKTMKELNEVSKGES